MYVMCFGVQVSGTETVQTESTMLVRFQLTFRRVKIVKACGDLKCILVQGPCYSWNCKLLHMSLYMKQVLQLMWEKSGMFKSSWDLFDDEPHSRNFVVRGKYMWPHPWFNAVLLLLPLHFKAYIFEIKNISLSPTGSLTERRLRSTSRKTVRSPAQLVWCNPFFQIHSFHFQVLSCHPISLHFKNSVPTE